MTSCDVTLVIFNGSYQGRFLQILFHHLPPTRRSARGSEKNTRHLGVRGALPLGSQLFGRAVRQGKRDQRALQAEAWGLWIEDWPTNSMNLIGD